MSKKPEPSTPISRAEEREEIKLALEMFSSFQDTGVALGTRTIYMGADMAALEGETGVDAKMAERFIKNLHILENLSHKPVRIILNTPGGDVYHGLAIYDAITESPCRVEIIVRGYAMSMGSIILQAADPGGRVMGPRSKQMAHVGSFGIDAHSRTVLKWAEETKRVDDWCEQMYLKRIQEKHPKFALDKLKEMLDHDHIMTAEESIELGLADRIG